MERLVGADIARVKGAEIVVAIFKPANPTRVEGIFDAGADVQPDKLAERLTGWRLGGNSRIPGVTVTLPPRCARTGGKFQDGPPCQAIPRYIDLPTQYHDECDRARMHLYDAAIGPMFGR